METVLDITKTSTDPNDIRAFFDEHGYYIARGVFSPEEISHLETDFDRIVDQLLGSGDKVNANWSGKAMEKLGASDKVIIHTHHVQNYSANWLRALLQERFLNAARAILGDDIILHHTKLFQKPSEKGSPFPMHQDWLYFPTEKDSMIAGIIHVSEATDEMGCFRVYPGSHRLGRLSGTKGQEVEGANEILERYPLSGATPLTAKAGDVVFFHYFLLHGSMPNVSLKTRKTVLVQMYRGDDKIEAGNTHSDSKMALSGWNSQARR